MNPTSERLTTIPNLLTLSRLPLAAVLFVCISYEWWVAALVTFALASLTDWLDGWWARQFNLQSIFGRTFDPLVDKVLVGGAFIYLLQVPATGLAPWMVTVVIGREILVTGIRGYIETLGKKFGADWFGKLKMLLQCVVLFAIFGNLSVRGLPVSADWQKVLDAVQTVLIYAMIAATVGSGIQYCVKAAKLMNEAE